MNKEEVAMIGFEIVAYAGDARSKMLEALAKAKDKQFDLAQQLIEEAKQCIAEAHKAQTEMLAKEASGEDLEMSFIMIHGQDHLMTTILLKDIICHLMEIYKKEE